MKLGILIKIMIASILITSILSIPCIECTNNFKACTKACTIAYGSCVKECSNVLIKCMSTCTKEDNVEQLEFLKEEVKEEVKTEADLHNLKETVDNCCFAKNVNHRQCGVCCPTDMNPICAETKVEDPTCECHLKKKY